MGGIFGIFGNISDILISRPRRKSSINWAGDLLNHGLVRCDVCLHAKNGCDGRFSGSGRDIFAHCSSATETGFWERAFTDYWWTDWTLTDSWWTDCWLTVFWWTGQPYSNYPTNFYDAGSHFYHILSILQLSYDLLGCRGHTFATSYLYYNYPMTF